MVRAKDLIKLFQMMYEEHWPYIWGRAEKGCVDCSGAFVYTMNALGGTKFPHGSNAIARRYIVGELLPIEEAKPGMAAFKLYEPGENGYSLPDKYKPGGASFNGDLNDYYHIGLVDEDIHYVLNAKGTKYGFCRDKLTGGNGWDRVAYLKGVDYEKEKGENVMQEAKVVLPSGAKGNTVNMRKSASMNADIYTKVPVGSVVYVEEDLGQWCKIMYENRTGYMLSNYLEYAGQADETDILTPEQRDEIDNALKEIERQIDVIGAIVGRG